MVFKNKQINPLSDVATRGRGFFVEGRKFVHHSPLSARKSAVVNITPTQKLGFLVAVLLVAGLLYISYQTVLLALVLVCTVFYFSDLLFGLFLAHRSFIYDPEIHISPQELKALKSSDLPTVTVFCPLYKEGHVLPQFVEAMQQLDYPVAKLQIMLQLEEDDIGTIQQAYALTLPKHFEIIVVPNSKPKTKPKAMNYGLRFATGEIVTIYDAEDIPDPLQLKKVAAAFKRLPEDVVCVQGKLNFYNPHQNLLTRMFTAEYSLWFDLVLPGLQSIGAPIPLGGTSNFFKKSVLVELAGWDAYNVTEDCDLGMRLAKHGYRTAIVDSTTLEEANSKYHNWYRQRSRWIKGYMQTYLVHMRDVRASVRQFGWRNLLLLQLTVGGKVLSMFINPLLWAVTFIYFAFRTHAAPYIEPYFPPVVLYIGVVSLIFGNFFYAYSYLIGLAKRREFAVMKYIFFVPLYWLGMSVAAWKALYELIVKPHYWQKTNHGLHLGAVQNQELGIKSQGEEQWVVASDEPLAVGDPSIVPVTSHSQLATRPSLLAAAWAKTGMGNLPGGTLLIAAMVGANFLNFVFSAVFGRKLAPADFGTLTLFAVLIQLVAIVAGSVGGSVTYRIARMVGSKQFSSMQPFVKFVAAQSQVIGFVIACVWVLVTPLVARFFHVQDIRLVLAFAPMFPIMMSQAVWGGFLRGDYAFKFVAAGVIADPIIKLITGAALVYAGRTDLVPLATLIAVAGGWMVLLAFGYSQLSVRKFELRVGEIEDGEEHGSQNTVVGDREGFLNSRREASNAVDRIPSALSAGNQLNTSFPAKFFGAALLAGSSATLFLTADVLLVKHFFTPELAGRYALLSLCGNMVFYFCSLPGVFITTVVSRARGEGKDGREAFLPLFRLVLLAALVGFIGAGVFGSYTIPFLFGQNAVPIVPYLPLYTAALGLMAVCSSYISYRISRDDFRYAWFGVAGATLMAVGIWFQHGSIAQVAEVVFAASASIAVLLIGFHAVFRHGRFVFRNLVDLLDIFLPLPGATAPLNVHSSVIPSESRPSLLSFRASHQFDCPELTAEGRVEESIKVAQYQIPPLRPKADFGRDGTEGVGTPVGMTEKERVFIKDQGLNIKDTSFVPKRILIFNWRDIRHMHAGGAERYVHEVAKRWAAGGNEVTLFCGSDGNAPRFETLDGVRIIRRGGFYMVWVWAFFYYMFRLRGKFDTVVDNNSALPFFTPLYVKEPVVCLMHHVHQDIFKNFLSWPAAQLACFLEAKFVPFVYRHTKFITVSNSTKVAMQELGIGRAGIEVVNPGVDSTVLGPGEKEADPLVVYVGRLNAYKSVDVLIRAFDLVRVAHPTAKLVIAGSGEEEENLKSLSKKLGLHRVVSFLGKVEEEIKVLLMQQAWVFANPSRMEGWGITSIEANACGTPVVASNVPGLRDSVQNPHTGYLVEYGNPAAFAEKIDLLLTNHKQRKFMEKESLEWAKNFNWDEIAKKNLQIIHAQETRN